MKKTITTFKLFYAVIILSFFVGIIPQTSFSQQWSLLGTAGFSADLADFISIAVDGSGTPYVAYQDIGNSSKATVMKFNGSSWVNIGNAGFSAASVEYISIAIDGNDVPYVAYKDLGNSSKATVMKFDGTNWVNVGNAGFSAGYPPYIRLAIDNNEIPFVVFGDDFSSSGAGGKASVMKFDGTSWVSVGNPQFSSDIAKYTSIVLDGSGTPYIAYQDLGNSSKATVMKFDGSNWVPVGNVGFSTSSAQYTSITLDNASKPYVAFRDGGSFNEATVMKFDGSNWVNVGNQGFSNSSADYLSIVMKNDTPFVAFQQGSFKASSMKFDGTNWVSVGTPNFSSGTATNTSLALGGNTLYIAYADGANSGKATVMKYTFTASSTKQILTFDFSTPAANGVINEANKTVTLCVPTGTNVTALVPTITHNGASISPLSGVAQDFTNPVAYTVTAQDNSTAVYNVTVNICSGIADKDFISSISISPNPNNGIFSISCKNNSLNNYQVRVTDIVGKIIFSAERTANNNFLIDLSNEPNGIYFATLISSEGYTMNYKVIISK